MAQPTAYVPPALSHPDAPWRVPVSTYRLQFNRQFTFADATRALEYLAALGVTECYAAPLLTASPGSTHGYDISNHHELSPDLGGAEGFERWTAALAGTGIGLVLDFVPNHMGIDPRMNAWWRDVLENGPSSPWSSFFDIDWHPVKQELQDKVLLPILGDQYGRVLERGELQLRFERGALELAYFDHRLPINPRQAPRVYRQGLDELKAALGEQNPDLRELLSILTALTNLPPYTERNEDRIAERQREKEVQRERLERLVAQSGGIAEHIETTVRLYNGEPGKRESFDLLHELLELQAYRLAYWRTAFDEINYRRFFDVNQLAALRMEDPRVFAATHGLLLDLVGRRVVTGVRIDHPDGLFDPEAYFTALQAAAAARFTGDPDGEASTPHGSAHLGAAVHEAMHGDVGVPAGVPRRLYVIAEKILSGNETLPPDWAAHGTTGYNFLTALNGLFVRADTLENLRRIYRRFTGERDTLSDTVYRSKRDIMRTSLAGELNVLAHTLNRLSEADRRSRDFTLNSLRRALNEVVAAFPVYRSYVTPRGISAADEQAIDAAISEARRRDPVMESSIFDFIRRILLPADADEGQGPSGEIRTWFTMKLQQYTGPVEAKGLEDTAFYRKVPLISANEVGGDPHHRAWTDTEFHERNLQRRRDWPFEMTTTATHDTKRGEDTRARINVISEQPDAFRKLVSRWTALHNVHRTIVSGRPAPDRNDEWFFYQSLAGVWPPGPPDGPVPERADDDLVARLTLYMEKAVKEAKRHTSWVNANAAYDGAVSRFVEGVLTGETTARFFSTFMPWQRRLAWFGMINSLAQVTIKMTSPGVPDLYQGTELWDFSLVDPDNRRPVDFEHRAACLEELEPLLAETTAVINGEAESINPDSRDLLGQLLDRWWDARAKLHVTTTLLRLRRARPELFLLGDYLPLEADVRNGHVIAFARQSGSTTLITMAPRFLATMFSGEPRSPFGINTWQTTRVSLPQALANAHFVNVFTGETVRALAHRGSVWLLAADIFSAWPVGVLISTVD